MINFILEKTEFSIEKRFKEHCKDSKRGYKNRPLYKAMNKYGIEHFSIELIEECSEQNICEREQYWIKYYDSFNNGYNATLGGDGKAYIDYNVIINLFLQGFNIVEIAEKTNHAAGHISKILKEKGNITQDQIDSQAIKKQERKVFRLDKNTKQVLDVYDSVAKASAWVKENGYSIDKIDGISSHICQCCSGIRKSAYKFDWSYE